MMTPEDIQSIRKTFKLMEGHTEIVAALFYKRLFKLDPSLSQMFRGDMKEQGKKLMAALVVLNASLDRFDTVRQALQGMGKRHAGYGVRREHYGTVGMALLYTLEEFAGPRFTASIREAWGKLLTLVCNEMLAGASEFHPSQQLAVAAQRAS